MMRKPNRSGLASDAALLLSEGIGLLVRHQVVGKCGKSAIPARGRWSAERDAVFVRPLPPQAVLAIQWLWSLRMLWVAATNRNSECTAALPLRINRSTRRLYLICPNTGSIVVLRRA